MENENQKKFTRLDAKDKLNECLQILEFMTDAVYVWNTDALDFKDNHRAGYACIMDWVRDNLAKNIEVL